VLAALSLLAFVVFYPSLRGAFVSDDINAIVTNEHVSGPLDVGVIFTEYSWWSSTRADAPGYRPLVTASFALQHQLSGNSPIAYHVVNVALHAIIAWLVYVIALRLGVGANGALASAVLFCVLPIHTEAVAWVVGRAELMAALGFAAALVLLLDYRASGQIERVVGAGAFFLAGLLSKENAVTLLAAPAICAVTLGGEPARKRRDLVATIALLAVFCAYLGLRATAGPVLPHSAGDRLDNPLVALDGLARLSGAMSVFGHYLWLSLFPYPLSVDYSYNALGIDAAFVADRFTMLGVAGAVALAAAGWMSRNRQPATPAGLLLAAASYSIVSNTILLIGTIMGERLFYLPSLGLCVAAGPALAWLAGRRAGLACLLVVALAYGGLTSMRAGAWSDPIRLFEAAVRAYPASARAHMELATAYGQAGRESDAEEEFRDATTIKPDYAAAWYNLGNLNARGQRYDAAARAYGQALEHNPKLVQAWYNAALVERLRGNLADAVTYRQHAAELATIDPDVHTTLADTLLMAGRDEEAVAAYTRALELGADPATAHTNRGVASQRAWDCTRALDDYLTALRIEPTHRVALANAVGCLQTLGRGDEASALIAAARVANRDTGR